MDTPRDIALQLMDKLLAGQLSTADFCSLYEHHFNFDWPDRTAEPQLELFDKLFDTVAWYSPFPEEREVIPNYTGDADVMGLVQLVRSQLAA